MQGLHSWPGSNSCRPRRVHSKIHETTPAMEVVAGHGWRTTAGKDSSGVCPPATQATAVSTHHQLASNRSSKPPWSFKTMMIFIFSLWVKWKLINRAEDYLQKSYSLVIGSPADQYICKKKARTEAAFSAGLPARPERQLAYWFASWYAHR